MITKTLTGRRRHRAINLMFKPTLLVLQVEESHIGYECDNNGVHYDVDCEVWRDATVEDMTVMDDVVQ